MTYMGKTFNVSTRAQGNGSERAGGSREPLVLVIEDDRVLSDAFRGVCECLNVVVERMPSTDDLASVLKYRSPMAIVAAMEAEGQDGCHVLMTVAAHDRDLPVLLITGEDAALLGAIDAVEEIWHLSSVFKWSKLLGIGAVVDFLFQAGRKGNCMHFMSV
jgi:CheY-like chemotaxis protein